MSEATEETTEPAAEDAAAESPADEQTSPPAPQPKDTPDTLQASNSTTPTEAQVTSEEEAPPPSQTASNTATPESQIAVGEEVPAAPSNTSNKAPQDSQGTAPSSEHIDNQGPHTGSETATTIAAEPQATDQSPNTVSDTAPAEPVTPEIEQPQNDITEEPVTAEPSESAPDRDGTPTAIDPSQKEEITESTAEPGNDADTHASDTATEKPPAEAPGSQTDIDPSGHITTIQPSEALDEAPTARDTGSATGTDVANTKSREAAENAPKAPASGEKPDGESANVKQERQQALSFDTFKSRQAQGNESRKGQPKTLSVEVMFPIEKATKDPLTDTAGVPNLKEAFLTASDPVEVPSRHASTLAVDGLERAESREAEVKEEMNLHELNSMTDAYKPPRQDSVEAPYQLDRANPDPSVAFKSVSDPVELPPSPPNSTTDADRPPREDSEYAPLVGDRAVIDPTVAFGTASDPVDGPDSSAYQDWPRGETPDSEGPRRQKPQVLPKFAIPDINKRRALVTIYYGPYVAYSGIIVHQTDRLDGLVNVLRLCGHRVILKPFKYRNHVELVVDGETVFKVDIRELEFGGDGLTDPMCQKAANAVATTLLMHRRITVRDSRQKNNASSWAGLDEGYLGMEYRSIRKVVVGATADYRGAEKVPWVGLDEGYLDMGYRSIPKIVDYKDDVVYRYFSDKDSGQLGPGKVGSSQASWPRTGSKERARKAKLNVDEGALDKKYKSDVIQVIDMLDGPSRGVSAQRCFSDKDSGQLGPTKKGSSMESAKGSSKDDAPKAKLPVDEGVLEKEKYKSGELIEVVNIVDGPSAGVLNMASSPNMKGSKDKVIGGSQEKASSGQKIETGSQGKVASGQKMENGSQEKVASRQKIENGSQEKSSSGQKIKNGSKVKVASGQKMENGSQEKSSSGQKMENSSQEKSSSGQKMENSSQEKSSSGQKMENGSQEKAHSEQSMSNSSKASTKSGDSEVKEEQGEQELEMWDGDVDDDVDIDVDEPSRTPSNDKLGPFY